MTRSGRGSRGFFLGWLAAAALAGAAGPALALDFDTFGHFNQNDPAFKDVCGGTAACGPVATLNSLVFLQKKYPKIYDNKLVGDDPVAAAKALAKAMACDVKCGTETENFFKGKKAYIEGKVPKKTSYIMKENPTFDFLAKEMKDGEDVELFIGYYKDGKFDSGHYVTLYDITDGKIGFVDPGGAVDGGLNGAINEKLGFGFDAILKQILLKEYGGTPEGAVARLDFSFSESPMVPEPTTWVLLITGLGMAGAQIRRHRPLPA